MSEEIAEKIVRELEHLRAAIRYVAERKDVTSCRTAIDGGANIGLWTEEMAEQFDRVYAFEPAEDTAQRLERRIGNLSNVVIRREALWSKSCMISVLEPDNRPAGRHRSRFVQPGGSIPAIAIDDLQLKDVALIKLDIEGAEYFALQGARKTLKHCRPVVILEELRKVPQKRYGIELGASGKFLESLGAKLVEQHRFDQIYVFEKS